jgi:succinyl-CoA synthetase beta subunit
MKLFEFEAKKIIQEYGIAIPRGNVISHPAEAETAARKIAKPVVLKSQVLVSGRGKSGGIVFAQNATEARKAASKLIGSKVKGISVTSVLIEEKIDIASELYASVAIDRQAKRYAVMASTSGGIDIEEVARATPEKISRYQVDPLAGFSEQNAQVVIAPLSDLDKDGAARFSKTIHTIYKIAMDYDAELVEINPLVKTATGEFVACDARIIVDDNALFRHPEVAERASLRAEGTSAEATAIKEKLAYVDLDGDIGIIGNGAGLVMATLDLVHLFGGKPANFLDIGGGAQAEVIKRAVMLVMSKPQVKTVLVNILGGVTRCDIVAQGVIEALKESAVKKPVVVRMIGTNEEEGLRMLHQAGIYTYSSMEEAIREAVKL